MEDDKCLYNYGNEYHVKYFEHMFNLDEDLVKSYSNISGICNHMMFETKYVNEIISKIEKKHNDLFYNVFLKLVTDTVGAGASEYEIYFNYMLKYHGDVIKIRKLNWTINKNILLNRNLDYISCHYHL